MKLESARRVREAYIKRNYIKYTKNYKKYKTAKLVAKKQRMQTIKMRSYTCD